MKHAGRMASLLGLVFAIALFTHEGLASILDLLRVGGFGLIVAALFHVVPMIANARAWQALMKTDAAPGLPFLVGVTWMREAINGLLPVARIGGEIAAYRSLVRRGMDSAPTAASLVVDLMLSFLSQSIFTLMGVGLAMHLGIGAQYRTPIVSGFVVLFALGAGLFALQGANVVGRLLNTANRSLAGRWSSIVGRTVQVDAAIRSIYARRSKAANCVAWQTAGWFVGAGEIWLALVFLGHRVAFEEAVVIEVFIQTVSSVAFVVPGAYGVQEGAFLLVGSALGLDGTTSLALAATRRIRDLVVFVPGLLAWTWSEARATPSLGRDNARS